MAQIIKLRRGTLAQLNSVTLQNGELGVVTSSVSNIGDSVLKTAIVAGHSDGTNRLSIARIITGNATPDLSGVTGGANFNDMLYHETDAKVLHVLNTGGNTNLDLTGNIKDREIGGALDVTGRLDAQAGLQVTGSLNVSGNGTFGGNLTFGDADTDLVTFSADIGSNLLPNTDDTYDIGSATQAWQDLFLEGDITLSDAGAVQSTAGNLTVDSKAATLVLDGHTGVDIDASNSGKVTIDGAGGIDIGVAADVAIDVNSSTFDLDASGAITIDSTAGISLDAGAASNLSTSAGALTVHGAGGINIGTTADVAIDIDSSTLDIDASGAISLDSSASTIAIGGNSVAQKISIGGDTSTRTEVELNAILVDINAGSGGITLNGAAASNLTTSAGAVTIDSEAANVLVDGHTGVEVTSTNSGTVTIDGKAGVAIQEDGTDVIAIDTNRDVLFSQTGGSTSDPDVEFDGYVRLDGITEVANSTQSTSTSTGGLIVDGGIGVVKNVNVGGNLTVTGDYTVNGTTTFISSSQLDIGDNIVQVNAVSPVRYGGLQVNDVNANTTGSIVWDSTNDYWLAGFSGSEYRVPIQNTTTALTNNRVVIAQGNGRIESSANITDDGSTVDFNDVDLTSLDKLEGVDTNTYIDIGGSGLIVTKGTIQPSAHNGNDLGATGTRYKDLWLQGNADLEGDIDVNGTANLDNTDIDGTLDVAGVADFQSRVDAQASLAVTGSVYVSTGASVAASSASLVAFRNANTQLGYLASANTQAITVGLIGYNTSGNLTVSSLIDGGSF
jgi:hypothetical protein